jgi:hypothetical protein
VVIFVVLPQLQVVAGPSRETEKMSLADLGPWGCVVKTATLEPGATDSTVAGWSMAALVLASGTPLFIGKNKE